MQSAETQSHSRALGYSAFLIAVEGVEGIVVEAGFVGGGESTGLFKRKRRRAGAVSGIRNRVILRVGGAGSDEGSRIIGRSFAIDVAAAVKLNNRKN